MHHSTQYATLESWLVLVIFFSGAVVALCAVVALFTSSARLWLIVKVACSILLFAAILLALLDHMGFV